MAFNDIEKQRIKNIVGGLCKKRTPDHAKGQLRYEYKINKQGHTCRDTTILERSKSNVGTCICQVEVCTFAEYMETVLDASKREMASI